MKFCAMYGVDPHQSNDVPEARIQSPEKFLVPCVFESNALPRCRRIMVFQRFGFPRRSELIHAALPDLTSETQLVLADVIGNDIGQHAGDIIAAFGRRKADLLKAGDGNVRRSQDGLSLDGRVRAQKQAQGLRVEAVVGVAKSLVEVVDAEQ